jgi:T5orf172 domain
VTDAGYVYVLFNPELKDLVKIGRTGRDPEGRAAELSGTALPVPFIVAYSAYFADAPAVERFIHTKLTAAGFRRAANREFFAISVSDAVKAVVETQAVFPTAVPAEASAEPVDMSSDLEQICDFAEALYDGRGEELEDKDRAIELYWKAADAGSVRAVLSLGERWIIEGSKISWSALRTALERLIAREVTEAWAYMAVGMARSGHKSNARKCWTKFFRGYRDLPASDRITWGFRFILFISLEEVSSADQETLRADRDAILSEIRQHATECLFKAELIFFPERISKMPTQRAQVVGLRDDGHVMLRTPTELIAVKLTDCAIDLSCSLGQQVLFIDDPSTNRPRIVKTEELA